MLETARRPAAAFQSSLRKARTSKNQSSPDDNCTQGGRSLWESCNTPCLEQWRRTTERADYSRTTSQQPIAKLPQPARRRASVAQPRKAMETRETRQANTIA